MKSAASLKAVLPSASEEAAQIRALTLRIGAVRQQRSTVWVGGGIARSVTVLLAVLGGEAVLDWLVELPWLARALALIAALGGAGYFIWRDAARPYRRPLSDDAIALLIERALPVFRGRYIAAAQLSREASRPALVRMLVAQTSTMAAAQNFRAVVDTAPMWRALKIAAAVLAACAGLAWVGHGTTPILLERAFLFNTPLPRKTKLLKITGDRKLGAGEDVRIDVTAGGVIPARGRVNATLPGGLERTFPLEAVAGAPGHFSALIRSPQDAFTYKVNLGDATSALYHVEVFARPSVADISCEQIYPPYVKLPPVRRTVGDLSLLAGSRLNLSIKASMKVREGSLRLAGINREIPLQIDPKDATRLHGQIEIPTKDLTGFSVYLVNPEGVDSGQAATYRIDITPDQPPAVKVTFPTRPDELATPQATLRVAFEARDDFGVAQVVLHYRADQQPEKAIPFDLGGRGDRVVVRKFDWKLSSLDPKPVVGSSIEYWITAEDTNNITGPGIGSSDHFGVKIVNAEDKRLDLANRFRDSIGDVNQIAGSEEEANKSLGDVIFQKPPPPPPPAP